MIELSLLFDIASHLNYLHSLFTFVGTLEFDKIDEIAEIGYRYAKPLVEEWAEENGW